jgi:hypothetical protein
MATETLALLEQGVALPRFVDEEAGPESNVAVLCEHPAEGLHSFEARALGDLETRAALPIRIVMVVSAARGRERMASRAALLHGARDLAFRAGGQVLVVCSGEPAAELVELASWLEVELRREATPASARADERAA